MPLSMLAEPVDCILEIAFKTTTVTLHSFTTRQSSDAAACGIIWLLHLYKLLDQGTMLMTLSTPLPQFNCFYFLTQ